MRKYSGFQYTLTASVVDTPKGAVRSLEITDFEVRMNDTEIIDSMCMTFNESALDTNTQQLKELCEFILEEINNPTPLEDEVS